MRREGSVEYLKLIIRQSASVFGVPLAADLEPTNQDNWNSLLRKWITLLERAE